MSKALSDLKDALTVLLHARAAERVSNDEVVDQFLLENTEIVEAVAGELIRASLIRMLPSLRQRNLSIVPEEDLFGGAVLEQVTVFIEKNSEGKKETQNLKLGQMGFTEAELYVSRNRRRSRPKPNIQFKRFLDKYKVARPYMLRDRALKVDDALVLARAESERDEGAPE